jgi:hypothetical protein
MLELVGSVVELLECVWNVFEIGLGILSVCVVVSILRSEIVL